MQCIKFSFSLTAGARFRWINNKSVPHSVFACRRGKNTCAPRKVYRVLIGWNCHTTWSQGNLPYIRLQFLKLDGEFFCPQPSLARLYSAAASPSERLRLDGSLAIKQDKGPRTNPWGTQHKFSRNEDEIPLNSTIIVVVVVDDDDLYHWVNLSSDYPFQVYFKVRQVLLHSATILLQSATEERPG